jgi:hypothetical protein
MCSTRHRDGRRILYKSHKLQLPASAPLAMCKRVGGTRGGPTPSKFNFPFSTGVSTPSTSLNLIPCHNLEKLTPRTPASPTSRFFVIQIPFVSASRGPSDTARFRHGYLFGLTGPSDTTRFRQGCAVHPVCTSN